MTLREYAHVCPFSFNIAFYLEKCLIFKLKSCILFPLLYKNALQALFCCVFLFFLHIFDSNHQLEP